MTRQVCCMSRSATCKEVVLWDSMTTCCPIIKYSSEVGSPYTAAAGRGAAGASAPSAPRSGATPAACPCGSSLGAFKECAPGRARQCPSARQSRRAAPFAHSAAIVAACRGQRQPCLVGVNRRSGAARPPRAGAIAAPPACGRSPRVAACACGPAPAGGGLSAVGGACALALLRGRMLPHPRRCGLRVTLAGRGR